MTESLTGAFGTAPSGPRSAVPPEPRSLVPWWFPLTLGIVSVAFGVVTVIWPRLTLFGFAVLVGLWLIVMGVSRIVGAFVHRPDRTSGQQVLSGILGVLNLIGGVISLR